MVLVSGFPTGLRLKEEELLDKLEIFFGKARNGGGDVETRELLQGSAILGFMKEEGKAALRLLPGKGGRKVHEAKVHPFSHSPVAQRLCQIGQFRVPLGGKEVPLTVSPYMSGKIQDIKVSRRRGTGPGNLFLIPKSYRPTYCQLFRVLLHPHLLLPVPASAPMSLCYLPHTTSSRSPPSKFLARCWYSTFLTSWTAQSCMTSWKSTFRSPLVGVGRWRPWPWCPRDSGA